MSEEQSAGIQMALDATELERKAIFASQEVDIQISHLRPWLEYRKATVDKWLSIPSGYPEISTPYADLFTSINKEIAKLMGL